MTDDADEVAEHNRDAIKALGLDFGEVNTRAEARTADGSFVWSHLSAFGQHLADRSARDPRWKHDGKFSPHDVRRRIGGVPELTDYEEALERMISPALLREYTGR